MSGGVVRHEPSYEIRISHRRKMDPIPHIEMSKQMNLKFGRKLGEVGIRYDRISDTTCQKTLMSNHVRLKLSSHYTDKNTVLTGSCVTAALGMRSWLRRDQSTPILSTSNGKTLAADVVDIAPGQVKGDSIATGYDVEARPRAIVWLSRPTILAHGALGTASSPGQI